MASRSKLSPISIIIGLVIITAIVGGTIYILSTGNSNTQTVNSGQVAGITTKNTQVNNPKVNINKIYQASALDVNGKTAKSKIEMNIKSAEKSQDILIKGQPANAKNGSAFLVLQVELKNSSNERLIVAPLDLIRLIVDNQKRAAEIYTEELPNIRGSVVVEPDSTKVTRVGFVLTPEIVDKKFKVQIGDVNAQEKQVVDIKL